MTASELWKRYRQHVCRIPAIGLTADVHSGSIRPPKSPRVTRVLVIGIGGSALGPMFSCCKGKSKPLFPSLPRRQNRSRPQLGPRNQRRRSSCFWNIWQRIAAARATSADDPGKPLLSEPDTK